MKKLFSYYKVLLIAVMAVTMVATFIGSGSDSASHSGSVTCDPTTLRCYEHVTTVADWDTANAAAQAMTHEGVSGHLVTLTSAAETQFVVANFATAVSTHAYIGGYRIPGDNWAWVTGEPFTYTNWSPGYPPEPTLNSYETVVEFFHSGTVGGHTNVGHWNDQNRAIQRTYVVEF